MTQDVWLYRALADAVLVLHAGIVAFTLGGLILILLGGARHWRWVRNPRFRLLHLATVAYVALQAWLGIACPLTTIEQWLRARAGQIVYDVDFIAYWLGRLLFFQAPPWVFIAVYTGFALLVALSWMLVRPTTRRPARNATQHLDIPPT